MVNDPNNSKGYFTNERSHYAHSEKFPMCQEFRSYIESIEIDFLNSLSQFCGIKNIKLSSICSNAFTNIIRKINPFLFNVPCQ